MNWRSPAALWALLVLQGACTLFFVFDATLDAIGLGDGTFSRGTQLFEYAMTLALVASVTLTALCLRELTRRQRALDEQVSVASGALEQVMQSKFEAWGLTPSETDVARLAIKGLSIAEMASVRGSAEGTIKAHSSAVYRKAGVDGRLQLISLFIEELMDDPPLAGVGKT